MKKILFMIIIIISIGAMTGCNKIDNKVKVHKSDESNVNYNSNSNEENLTVNETQYYEDYENHNIVYKKYDNNGETFSVMVAYDKNNKEIWKYTTDTVADPQFSINTFLGGSANRVYLKANTDVIVFDTTTGKEINRLKDVGYNLHLVGGEGMGGYDFIADGEYTIKKIYAISNETATLEKTTTLPSDLKYDYYKVESFNNCVISLVKVDDNTTEETALYRFVLIDTLENDWPASYIETIK